MGVDLGPSQDAAASPDDLAHAVAEVVSHCEPADHMANAVIATHTRQVGIPHFVVSVVWPAATAGPDPATLIRGLVAEIGNALPATSGIVITWPGGPDPATAGDRSAVVGAWTAVTRAAAGDSGRIAVFPGEQRLRGVMSVAEVVAASGIDRVADVSGSVLDDSVLIDTMGFVRPRWRAHRMVLQIQRGPDGLAIPFEREHMLR